MRKEKDMGRTPGHLAEDETQLGRDSVSQTEKDSCRGEKDILETMLNDLYGERTGIESEKSLRGIIPEGVGHGNLLHSFFIGFLLCISLGGAWVFLKWAFEPFGFGNVETILLAVAVILIFLETINVCLNFLQKRFSTAKKTESMKE